MSTFLTTAAIAAIIVVLAILLMAVGWLLTGKSKIIRGACGMDPKKRQESDCGSDIRCDLCEHNPEKKKDDHAND
ncbi:MAG: hypothetical protein Q8K75_12355 [Chlamydiales bacterium]|nr:hypothetical protein [Chlamydiales bacterium]